MTDETRTIAQGLPTLDHRDNARLAELVAGLVREHKVDRLVLGLPLSMSGKPSRRSEQVLQLAGRLRNLLKLPVDLYDERHSTSRAVEVLDEVSGRQAPSTRPRSKGRSRSRRDAADRIAAILILQDYLSESEASAGPARDS